MSYDELVGSSQEIEAVRDTIEQVARFPFPVRVEGPTGCGKGLVARLIHRASGRRGEFVSGSVTLLAAGLEVGSLVGHREGAFTGASRGSSGWFEKAHGGTLFLDEIGDATAKVQKALLPLLDEQRVTRLGDTRSRLLDVRVVFATNRDLAELVREGFFREDLLYRLGATSVRVPSLAARREDIPILFDHLLRQQANHARVEAPDMSSRNLDSLMAYGWPGNVRELTSMARHFLMMGRLPDSILPTSCADRADRARELLAKHKGNVTAASREMGVSRPTMHKLKRILGAGKTV